MATQAPNSTVDLDDPQTWDALLQELDPASLLVLIESFMGHGIRRRYRAEDVLQDALLIAWRDRDSLEWRGLRAFRGWLIAVAEHCVHDLVKHERATKRGGERNVLAFSEVVAPDASTSSAGAPFGPFASTTPALLLEHRERADGLSRALEELPAGLRDVVRLRLVEGRSTADVATALGIGVSAVKHRLRTGARLYRSLLRQSLQLSGATATCSRTA